MSETEKEMNEQKAKKDNRLSVYVKQCLSRLLASLLERKKIKIKKNCLLRQNSNRRTTLNEKSEVCLFR